MATIDINRLREEGAGTKAAKGLGKIIAVIIVLAVALLGDVMYVIEMTKVFPSGFLLAFCYLGAFTSFMAVGYLLLGKSVTFRPGGQLLAAWVVFAAELIIIALNIMLVFNGGSNGPMAAWAFFSPATPVLHMLGVALIFFLDPDLKIKHMEMEAAEKIRKAELDYALALNEARIGVMYKQLDYTKGALEEAVNSPESQRFIQQHGRRMNAGLLSDLSGRSLPMLESGEGERQVHEVREYTSDELVDLLKKAGANPDMLKVMTEPDLLGIAVIRGLISPESTVAVGKKKAK